MTKKEHAYIQQLVSDNNDHIKAVYNKTMYDFMSKEQRTGYIQGVSAAMEPFAVLVGMKVASVDLNHMD